MSNTHFLALLTLLAPLTTAAESWTNQAGRVIEAALQDFDGTSVTLVRTNGAPFRLPLTALCASDQQRARLQFGQSITPDFVQTAYRDAWNILDRFHRLPANQQTPEGRGKAARMAYSVFDKRLAGRAAELQGKAVQAEVERLRASIAQARRN